MRTIRVELPDGRLLKIEGGDAESTAKLLVNHYLGQGPVGPVAAENDAEDVLPVPGLGDFRESSKAGPGGLGRQPEPAAIRQPIYNVPVANEGDEAPLELP